MRRPATSLLAAGLLAGTGGLLGGVLAAPTAYAAETCQGKPATVIGTPGELTSGTEGNDVIVTNGAAVTLGLGGDDLICIAGGQGASDGVVKAGAGNDVVDASAAVGVVLVELGAGSDTYTGTAFGENVSGGTFKEGSRPAIDTEADTISLVPGGDDSVNSGSDPAVVNNDIVTLQSQGIVRWTGPIGPSGRLTGVNESTLSLAVGSGEVAVDSAAGTMAENGTTLLSWTGFGRYDITSAGDRAPRSFAFTGSERDEELALEFPKAYRGVQRIDLAGGNDVLRTSVGQDNLGRTGSAYQGGAGRDQLLTWNGARSRFDVASGRMESRVDGRWVTTKVRGFEDRLVGARTLTMWGTSGRDHLAFVACKATVRGRGGKDVIDQQVFGSNVGALPCKSRRFELYGDGGADVLRGGIGDDLLIGGAGRDVIFGNAGRDRCSGEKLRSCEVRLR